MSKVYYLVTYWIEGKSEFVEFESFEKARLVYNDCLSKNRQCSISEVHEDVLAWCKPLEVKKN